MQDHPSEKWLTILEKFTIGIIAVVGILVGGIVSMIGFNSVYEQTPYDSATINALNDVHYDEFRDNDTHYERVDREKKYYASMTDIETVNDNSIKITFDANYFQFDRNGGYVESQSQGKSELVVTISRNDTFVAGCNSFSLRDDDVEERVPVKQIHILRYEGITEKEGVPYYGFAHEAGYISNDMNCKFPDMIKHSLGIDFDVSDTNFYGDVWDNDWN